MRELVGRVPAIAANGWPVVIHGEAGTGKLLLARLLHANSPRAQAPIAVVAGADPEGLSELDPLAAGLDDRMTGGNYRKRIEQMNGGVLIVRNVEDLSSQAQSHLLGLLDAVCERDANAPDVRVIATTTVELEIAVRERRFRRELFDRLIWSKLYLPPLRDRLADIKPLCEHFLRQCQVDAGTNGHSSDRRFTPAAIDKLTSYRWPGNVGEFAPAVVCAAIASKDEAIEVDALPDLVVEPSTVTTESGEMVSIPMEWDLKKIEHHLIIRLLERHNGNKAAVARALNLSRRTLYHMLQSRGD